MIALMLAILLQVAPATDDLQTEGVGLGRLSSAVALCAEFGYRTNEDAARRIVDDFESRARAEGWTSGRLRSAYEQGRTIERDAFGVIMDLNGVSPAQARRAYLRMLNNTKRRCRFFAGAYEGVVSDLSEGDRTVDIAIAQMRRGS